MNLRTLLEPIKKVKNETITVTINVICSNKLDGSTSLATKLALKASLAKNINIKIVVMNFFIK